MAKDTIHKITINNSERLSKWFKSKTQNLGYPIYSSYDIRDAGFKVSNVDGNIYPAGFNNICSVDKETSVGLFDKYIKNHYGSSVKKILLVTEEHTQNPYYWENIYTISSLLKSANFETQIAIPRALESDLLVKSSTGIEIKVGSALLDSQLMQSFKPDLVISNNDFSESYADWASSFPYTINPPRELGWYQRQKSRYFKHFNQVASEFSDLLGIDPFLLRVETEEFQQFDISNDMNRSALADRVDAMISNLTQEYNKRGIHQKPVLFIKNNSGTYGLAVIRVESGAEVKQWSYKSRKKMKAAKGGREVESLIIQEGIPSIIQTDGATAEPVIYMVGCELAGGFLRTHSEKSSTESLNSPGAVYKRLCISDLEIRPEGCPQENVYGWAAKLGLLAIALEAKEMGVEFKDFQNGSCSLT